ncbi:unnamed protein product [Coffea canephora]|uniref:Bromo domain-containing protein n=1 Tax=Coffea canephora TaxID=49390 RepID=A0A068TNN2_COFCA|nr:unnamed protein product [Coffea canephora]
MKRRRKGGKKGKAKKPRTLSTNEVAQSLVTSNTEDNPVMNELDNDEFDSGPEAESPSSTGADLPEKPPIVDEKPKTLNPGHPNDDTKPKLVYGRVKVKIKASKALDLQLTSSDAPTHSDTEKSGQQVEVENQGAPSEKMEDSANSLPESNIGNSGNSSKRSGSIKLKSSRGFSSSSMSPCSNVEMMKGESTQQKEPGVLRPNPQHDKQELDASLEVIKKVMKMEAAEPFNVPVNPVALGVPDYFDVIDTPMDFGTICSNLESGIKYMNSEDVYRDVQYIWDNCYKYNNKGDYILELMKRVKKNFMKHWTAAGLYSDHAEGTNGSDTIQAMDVTPSIHGKMPVKNGALNAASKKRHGLKKHKDGCLCAICVMMRRRQDREETSRMLDDQFDAGDGYMDEEVKPEEASPTGSPGGDYSLANMDNSQEQVADADLEEKGDEMKLQDTENISQQQEDKPEDDKENLLTDEGKEEGEICEQLDQRSKDEHDAQNHPPNLESGDDLSNKASREKTPLQHEDNTAAIEQRKTKELLDKNQRAKMYERLRYLENPMLFELCGTLFDDKNKSVWTGPHSLVHQERFPRKSSILAAITSFMK